MKKKKTTLECTEEVSQLKKKQTNEKKNVDRLFKKTKI
jgi:hypothetical protein